MGKTPGRTWTEKGADRLRERSRGTILLVVFALFGLGLPGWSQQAAGQDTITGTPEEAFIAWARDHAVVLKTTDPAAAAGDLAVIKSIVGDARVVLLGQTERDAREQFQLSHRLIKFLVEQMGFTALALEENLATSQRINAYLLRGEGDPEALVAGMSAWQTWANEDFLALLKWLRAYDKNPVHKQKVRFYGIDITDPYVSMRDVMAYLERVDPEYAVYLEKGPIDFGFLKADSWLQLAARYSSMGRTRLQDFSEYASGVLSRFEEKRSDYIALSSEAEYAWALREAACVKKASDFFILGTTASPEEVGNIRTTAMVDNLMWVVNEAAKGERVIVWAHNIHVSRDYVEVNVPGAPKLPSMYPMGQFLKASLGGKMVSVGFSFNRGAYPDSAVPPAPKSYIDGALAGVGKPLFVIDLRTAPADGPVRTWLNTRNAMRGLGGVTRLVPAQAYDAIIFVDEITPTLPTAAARARFEKLDRARFSTRTTF
jgi:erythromycin esterase